MPPVVAQRPDHAETRSAGHDADRSDLSADQNGKCRHAKHAQREEHVREHVAVTPADHEHCRDGEADQDRHGVLPMSHAAGSVRAINEIARAVIGDAGAECRLGWRLRLPRSTAELLAIEADLSKRGIGLVIRGERLTATRPASSC